jgi:CTP synthase
MHIIVVTGWVLSGIGKGISGSSIWALLKASGYHVFMQKFDGYLNADAGTINPYKHGECFVTNDGAETDLDIWHYERYLDTDMNSMSIYTSGKLMQEIMEKERQWDYLGNDVQIIPHFTNLIKDKVKHWFTVNNADISIVEVWGTVGDMENESIVEAMRQLRHELGHDRVMFVHLTYIPYLLASKELKTKPTQNSVKDLRMRGIIPDMLICRADYDIPDDIISKISYMTGVSQSHVIPAPTVDSIYRIPLDYADRNVSEQVLSHLWLPIVSPDMTKRQDLYHHISNATQELRIAMVGKYVGLEDAYYSLNEGIKVAGFYHDCKVKLVFIEAEELTQENIASRLDWIHGICVPWWFGTRGIEGMILAAQYAREQKIPYLGICLGSQIMAMEFARNVLGLVDATSAEFDEVSTSSHHVIHIMESQKSITHKGWSMRLGAYDCVLDPTSKTQDVYSRYGWCFVADNVISERHRHRYEFNNDYRDEFTQAGFLISWTSPDGNLVEMVELADHPFMLATQAHPELKSRPTRPHPLFLGFVEKVKKCCV